MTYDRMTTEARDGRVALCYIAFEEQDNGNDDAAILALLLAQPTPGDYPEDDE